MNERFEKVDIVKTIGIIAVVLGHIANPYSQYIFSWHMPLFFFIAGYLCKDHNENSLYSKILTEGKKYLSIFISFNILGIIVANVRNYFLGRSILTLNDIMINTFLYTNSGEIVHYGFVLWFIPALFWAKSFFKILRKTKITYILYICIILLSLFLKMDFNNYLGLRTGLEASIYLFMGYLYRNFYINDYCSKKYFNIIAPLLAIILLWYLSVPTTNMQMGIYSDKIICFFYALINIFLIFKISELIAFYSKNKLNRFWYFGRNSLSLMIAHVYTNNLAYILVEKLFKNNYWIIKLLLSLLLSFFIIEVFHFARGKMKNRFEGI